ncbi:hypothetical protein SAMN04487981_13144 [Streptomyces sp. cf386]|uniref:hypothetical protein n=1 Tax=Streptomyces sp. cf386 TaxID=1761904 RepID=UPI0008883148|nr:hypothetical protein [Streptomyces sp. cf386]SDP65550.1 hypothetical protein SAMN04487981_13144 [Streptomyces sp. cf386]
MDRAEGQVEAIRNRIRPLDLPAGAFGKLSESESLKADYDTQSTEAEADLKDVMESLTAVAEGARLAATAYDTTEEDHVQMLKGLGGGAG